MNRFEYIAPETVREAAEVLQAHPGARVLAGGTDLLVQMKERARTPDTLVDLRRIPGLDELRFDGKTGLTIGAAVTMRQVELMPATQLHYTGLAEGARVVGSFQIRNLATIVGNICNAAPSADAAPGLIVHGAKVKIAGPKGRRTMLVENFMAGPGRTTLGTGEFVVGIHVPVPPPRTGSAYVRHTPRGAMDIAMVGVGAAVTLAPRTRDCQEARIVLGAVAPTPLRAKAAERMLKGQRLTGALIERAAKTAAEEARPISDVRGSADFRREMVRVLTGRMVNAAFGNAQERSGDKRRAA
ncbi:MAG: xanthine dehydrogenase family protein subunit M [Gemmatimonadetes bacterium]|nr:xanthine dehydrogenase family protein subunit M [Gemmatimonadota bacterium]